MRPFKSILNDSISVIKNRVEQINCLLDDLEKSKKDIEENYELFEKDFNCLEFLAKHSPDEMEISPEEKKILERHFGKYGLDVRTRLGVEPTQDFDQEDTLSRLGTLPRLVGARI